MSQKVFAVVNALEMHSSYLEDKEKMQGNDKIYMTFDAGFKKK